MRNMPYQEVAGINTAKQGITGARSNLGDTWMDKLQQLAGVAKDMPWPKAVSGEMGANMEEAYRRATATSTEQNQWHCMGADWGWTNCSRVYLLKLRSEGTKQRGKLARSDDPQQWQPLPHTK